MATVTNSTVKVNTFKTIYDLLNAGKPSGWTVLSSFPEAKPVFPCIVVNPVRVSVMSDGLRLDARRYDMEIELDFFAKASSRKEAVDSAIDTVRELLMSDASSTTFKTANLILFGKDPIEESESVSIIVNNDKLSTGSIMVKLRKL